MTIKKYNREPIGLALAKQEFKGGVERELFYLVMNQIKSGINLKTDLFKNVEINIPTTWLKETNYKRIREGAENITSRKIRFIDDENKEFRYIVPFPEVSYTKGELRIILYDKIAKDFMELSNGYTEYELEIMQSIRSDYTQRLYEILSGKKKMNKGLWRNVSIDYLKKILNAENYALPGNFIQRVIEPAKAEMDKKGDIGFEYEKIRTGRKLTHITFSIYYIGEDDKIQQEIAEDYDYIASLDNIERTKLITTLVNQYKFTPKQQEKLMRSNKLLTKFYEVNKKIEAGFFGEIVDKNKYMAVALGFNK